MTRQPALQIRQGLGVKPVPVSIGELTDERDQGGIGQTDSVTKELVRLRQLVVQFGQDVKPRLPMFGRIGHIVISVGIFVSIQMMFEGTVISVDQGCHLGQSAVLWG